MDLYLVQCIIFYNINCSSGYNISIKIKIIEVYLRYVLENILNIDSFILKKLNALKVVLILYVIRFLRLKYPI
jgi:hypothetical protein